MAFNQLFNPLNPFAQFFAQIAQTPPPPLPALDNIWEWDDLTGQPIFPDPQRIWRRFLPSTLRNEPWALTPVGAAFVNGMEGDLQTFPINCQTRSNCLSLLRRILNEDIKKIGLVRNGYSVTVNKTNAPLIPFDPPGGIYPLQELRTDGKTVDEFITEINLNSQRGHNGPGTFWCRESRCTRRPLMTASPVVQWGPAPNQVVNLRTRFTCASKNLVYLLYCNECLRQGRWTTYCGETDTEARNAHERIHQHIANICCQTLADSYPTDDTLPDIVSGRMEEIDPDEDQLMRDPYTHFNFLHRPEDRRYTFIEGGFANTFHRRGHEYMFTAQFGSFVYSATNFSGSLNH